MNDRPRNRQRDEDDEPQRWRRRDEDETAESTAGRAPKTTGDVSLSSPPLLLGAAIGATICTTAVRLQMSDLPADQLGIAIIFAGLFPGGILGAIGGAFLATLALERPTAWVAVIGGVIGAIVLASHFVPAVHHVALFVWVVVFVVVFVGGKSRFGDRLLDLIRTRSSDKGGFWWRVLILVAGMVVIGLVKFAWTSWRRQ